MSASASLNAARRQADLDRFSGGEVADLLVVGGGITGVGVALDAAARGLRTVLVERRDLANGTSRWSSKLIHGGLRYLRHFEMGLAWESARERHLLMTTVAPHLVRPLPFVAPLNDTLGPVMGALTEVGVRVGDGMRLAARTRGRLLPRPRRISAGEALRLIPSLREDGLRGALLFWDGQLEDDARLVVAVARTAARHGASILTYCSVESLERGLAWCRDERSGERFTIRARNIVNAAGVWAGSLASGVQLQPSKGAHLVVDAQAVGDPRAAVVVPVEGESARWVGATPVGSGRVLVGVTDEAWEGEIADEPEVTEAEERFLLSTLSGALQRPVSSDAVRGRFAGYRPLLRGGGSTADLSRRHALVTGPDGVLTVVGGKLTTYRRMAADAVDAVAGNLAPRSTTAHLPLVGAASAEVLRGIRAPERLLRRYGTEAPEVAALAQQEPSLLEPLAPGLPVLGVELVFGILHEGALTIDDLLDRRVRLGLVPEERVQAEAFATDLLNEHAA